MKKITICLIAIVFISVIYIAKTYNMTNAKSVEFYGDKDFINEISKKHSDVIVSNAIYVSPEGNDADNGTLDRPFKTIQKALDIVKAGQTIYVREGSYSALNTFSSSGRKGKYITLRNYPGEHPRLTMSNKDGAIISIDGNDYIIIEGLEICDFTSAVAYGILLDSDESHIIIRNNRIHDICTTMPFENGEANAILCYGEGRTEEAAINNIFIENNEIYNNVTGWCEALSIAGNAKYINIVNNTVHDNTNIGIDFYGNAGYCQVAALDQPRFCTAIGNTVYNSLCDYAECAGIYVDGARDIVVERNEVYSNMYGIEIGSEELSPDFPVKNIVVRNNLVYDNPFGGIRVGGFDIEATGYVTDTQIYSNTLINNGEGDGGWNGELCFLKCDGIDVENNIVYKESDVYPLIGGEFTEEYVRNVTFNQNTYYSPSGADEIYFEFKGEAIYGMNSFNSLTGGNDIFDKPVLSFESFGNEN